MRMGTLRFVATRAEQAPGYDVASHFTGVTLMTGPNFPLESYILHRQFAAFYFHAYISYFSFFYHKAPSNLALRGKQLR